MVTKKLLIAASIMAATLATFYDSAKAASNIEELEPGVTVRITCVRRSLPGNPAAVSVELDSYRPLDYPGEINRAELLVYADFEIPQPINGPVEPPTPRYSPLPRVFFGGRFPINNASVRGSFTTTSGREFQLPNRGVGTTCD